MLLYYGKMPHTKASAKYELPPSERNIYTLFITLGMQQAGWDSPCR